MKSVGGLPLFFAILAGCAEARELGRIEQAAAGRPYDYVVHVPNTYSIGYNPEVREDRYRIARQTLRGQCRAPLIVGDDKNITAISAITTTRPAYLVMVKCA